MFKAIISYDGTRYFGWQKTASGPSIQEELEKAIAQITGEKRVPEAASRTDRGVHARGQVVQFSLEKATDLGRLQRGLNAVLPKDIRLLTLKRAADDFHPTLNAMGKEYHYRFCLSPAQDPTDRLYSWHFYKPLDFHKMEQAAADFIGTHHFSAFANEKEENPLCTVQSIVLQDNCIQIRANRFLYKMARNIAGTLLYIGCGKLSASVPEILQSGDRKKGGVTAPAHGLHLHQVFYPIE